MQEYKILLEGSKFITVKAENVYEAFKVAEKESGLSALECEEDWA